MTSGSMYATIHGENSKSYCDVSSDSPCDWVIDVLADVLAPGGARPLTHWPLGDFNEILDKLFSC